MGVIGAGIWVSLNEGCWLVLLEEGWVGATRRWGGVLLEEGGGGGVIRGGGGVDIIGGALDESGCYWRRVCMEVGLARV